MAEPARAVVGSVVRGALALPVLLIGWGGVRLLTAVPGYGRTRRGSLALQGFSRLALRALGVRVVSRGSPRSGPSLVVANHQGWLDVLVLAAAGPIVPLIDEAVLRRPIGRIAGRIGAIVFRPGLSRNLSGTIEQVTTALRRGHRVLVFPECGRPQVVVQRPDNVRAQFSRAAFQAAVDAAAVVSPVAVSYRIAGVTSTTPDDVLGLLWRILRAGPLMVRVTWLPVIPAVSGPGHRSGNRDAAARRTEWAIDRELGRRVMAATPPVPERLPALALAS